MIRVADVIMRWAVDKGVHDVFTVSGGGIMYLVDALGNESRLCYRVNNHEQASAIAAEAYARVTGGLGICLVTTGPGGTNALSALAGAFVDSIPVMCISGQVRREVTADYSRQRQNGPQEINIVPMVRPVTKYAVTLTDPERILIELETAYGMAMTGRPGPVWIDVPLDVQNASVDEAALVRPAPVPVDVPRAPADRLQEVAGALAAAQRPLLIAGAGIRAARAVDALRTFLRQTEIPVVLTIGAMDLVAEDDSAYLGKFGPVGQRRANFALQNADVLLSVGASMSISSIGYNTNEFAVSAHTRIMVNVDESELDKPNYRPDLRVHSDAAAFFTDIGPLVAGRKVQASQDWIDACARWKSRYPLVTDEHHVEDGFVSSYVLVDALSDALTANDVLLTGNSLDAATVYQAFRVRAGQRVFTNVNFGAMGWDLPAAVGAACAAPGSRVVVVTGDGSIQFNVQELMTLVVNRLNVKIFVLNNGGYESIRATQQNHFNGHFVGSDFASGIGNPDFELLASAYGLWFGRISRDHDLKDELTALLEREGPALIEVCVSPKQTRIPKVASFRRPDGMLESKPLHDMYPWLPPEEIAENMALFADTAVHTPQRTTVLVQR